MYPRSFRKMPHRRATDTEPLDRILLWAVQLQGRWRSISTELSPDTHRGWPPHPSQRSGGCSTFIEEREVSWSQQHPSRTGPSRWRGCYHRSHDNLQQHLADRRMTSPVDPVLSHHTSQARQPTAVPEVPNEQPHKPPKQSHAEDHAEQIEVASGEDHRWRTGRLQSRKEHHRADLQHPNPLWEISPVPASPLPCPHRLQESLRQGLACSFVGNHEEVQHQHKLYSLSKLFISQIIIPQVMFCFVFLVVVVVVLAYLYSAGTQHGNLHPTGWPILLCGPTQDPVLAIANIGKNLERFWKKCRWMDRKGRNKRWRNSWQQASHVWLYTDPLQTLKGERLSSVFSPDETLISASAAPNCGANIGLRKCRVEET